MKFFATFGWATLPGRMVGANMVWFGSLQVTLATVLEQIDQADLPVEKTWRLNERSGNRKFENGRKWSGKIRLNSLFVFVT